MGYSINNKFFIYVSSIRQDKSLFVQSLALIIEGNKICLYERLNLISYRSIGALIVYDVTRKETFENITRWINETNNYANEKMIKILIGNKNDLSHKYKISEINSCLKLNSLGEKLVMMKEKI